MRRFASLSLFAVATTTIVALAMTVVAQSPDDTRDPGPDGGRAGRREGGPPPRDGEGRRPARPPRPPLEVALDADDDGEISASEIENAAAALKKLDKNGDGKLSADEFRPPRPPRDGGPDAGQRPGERRGPPGDAGRRDNPPPRGGRRPPPPRDDGNADEERGPGRRGRRPPPPPDDGGDSESDPSPPRE
jgi:hypothetical protein